MKGNESGRVNRFPPVTVAEEQREARRNSLSARARQLQKEQERQQQQEADLDENRSPLKVLHGGYPKQGSFTSSDAEQRNIAMEAAAPHLDDSDN